MFARQRLGVLDSKVQSPYTLRAILTQNGAPHGVPHAQSDLGPSGSLRFGTFGEDVQHHYPDHLERPIRRAGPSDSCQTITPTSTVPSPDQMA